MTVLASKTLTVILMFVTCGDVVIGGKIANVTRMRWGGTIALFAVPRERVAAKLSEMTEGNSCFEGVVSLPNRPILKEFLREDQHVVGISIGNLRSTSFIETLFNDVSSRYSLKAATVQFFIPMLTGPDPDGPLQYKVVLNSFVSTDKPFLKANVAVPTNQVEEIVLNENGLYMKDGDEYLCVSWKVGDTCETVNYVVNDGFDEFIDELVVPYSRQLNFSACEVCGVEEVDLCRAREKLSCTVSRNRFNACEVWTPLDRLEMCKLKSYSIDAISSEFQSASLLSDADHLPIVSEIESAVDYLAGLEVPCTDSI